MIGNADQSHGVDLDSGAVRGGAERNATVELNWYPERNFRLMADYVHALVHRLRRKVHLSSESVHRL